MSWTTSDDVVDSWIGADIPADDVLIQKWIERAEREIRFRVPDLQARIDEQAEETPPRVDLLEVAVDVTVSMVTRVFRNPEGIRQTNTTAGSYTESRTYGGDVPGGLGLTADEVAKLQGDRGGAFMIDLMPATAMRGWRHDW